MNRQNFTPCHKWNHVSEYKPRAMAGRLIGRWRKTAWLMMSLYQQAAELYSFVADATAATAAAGAAGDGT
jgi:hypothetical protein